MANASHPELSELKSAPPFSALSHAEQLALQPRLTPIEIQAGKFLIKEGSSGSEMYFLVKGSVKICTFHNGKEAILNILQPGEVVGDISVLCGGPRIADVVALTPCRLLTCTKEHFETHLHEFGGLAHMMLKNLALRVRSASMRISDLALYDVSSRLARVLFEMSAPREIEGGIAHAVDDPPTHQALASMIGSSREAVTRALKELERTKHIIVEDSQIFVLSVPM
jgi:CRP/FNR family transcriptional regulator, cyclic AMP receptor protein